MYANRNKVINHTRGSTALKYKSLSLENGGIPQGAALRKNWPSSALFAKPNSPVVGLPNNHKQTVSALNQRNLATK